MPPEVGQRAGHQDTEHPDDNNGDAGPALDHVGLEGEHDAEETITGDEGQGEDGGQQGQDWGGSRSKVEETITGDEGQGENGV